MNCFQIIIFVTSETTNVATAWIKARCELLSNYYLCDVRNNRSLITPTLAPVVNCFQIIIFVTSETTCRDTTSNGDELWIAFKLLSLWRQKQQLQVGGYFGPCCELLSNYYLCDVRNNLHHCAVDLFFVVNCFQIIIFVTSETTNAWKFRQRHLLWIAFKLLSLWRQKQQPITTDLVNAGCELLSNYYLCDVRNNSEAQNVTFFLVVNCFQIIIFVTSETTKNQGNYLGCCCELLSNYYLCDVRNNRFEWYTRQQLLWIAFKLLSLWRQKQLNLVVLLIRMVVNCFQIIIFVTSETTHR